MVFEIIIGVMLMVIMGMVYGISLRLGAIQEDIASAERASLSVLAAVLKVGEQVTEVQNDLGVPFK